MCIPFCSIKRLQNVDWVMPFFLLVPRQVRAQCSLTNKITAKDVIGETACLQQRAQRPFSEIYCSPPHVGPRLFGGGLSGLHDRMSLRPLL